MLEDVAERGARRVEPGEDEHGQHVEQLGVGERAVVEAWRAADARRGRRGAGPARRGARPARRPSTRGCRRAPSPSPPARPGRRRSRGRSPRPTGRTGRRRRGRCRPRSGTPRSGSAGANPVTKSHSPDGGDVVQELPAERAQRRLGRVHRARREPRVDDPAVLDVVGRVDLRRHEAVDRVGLPGRDRLAGEQLRRLVDVTHGVMAREDPVALRERVEEDRAPARAARRPSPSGSRPAAGARSRDG